MNEATQRELLQVFLTKKALTTHNFEHCEKDISGTVIYDASWADKPWAVVRRYFEKAYALNSSISKEDTGSLNDKLTRLTVKLDFCNPLTEKNRSQVLNWGTHVKTILDQEGVQTYITPSMRHTMPERAYTDLVPVHKSTVRHLLKKGLNREEAPTKLIVENIEQAGFPITVGHLIRAVEEQYEKYHDVCMQYFSYHGYSQHAVLTLEGDKSSTSSSNHKSDKKRLSGNSESFNEKKKMHKNNNSNPTDTSKACNHCGFSSIFSTINLVGASSLLRPFFRRCLTVDLCFAINSV